MFRRRFVGSSFSDAHQKLSLSEGAGLNIRKQAETKDFFANSDWLDWFVLRPLSHISSNWELTWRNDLKRYEPEPYSFAADLNEVVYIIATCSKPKRYHDHEDVLAERVIRDLKWPIQKKGKIWVGADYQCILEQGSFHDLGQRDLITAAAGRVDAAIRFGQNHFDEMEEKHMHMLAALVTIIIYHRYCDGSSLINLTEGQ